MPSPASAAVGLALLAARAGVHGGPHASHAAFWVGATVVSPCAVAEARSVDGRPAAVSCAHGEAYEIRRRQVRFPAASAEVTSTPPNFSVPGRSGAVTVQLTEVNF